MTTPSLTPLPLTQAIRPTTLLRPEALARALDLRLTICTETFQRTGSFKFRAGYNLALNVPNPSVIAASSGNFGQALAFACQLLGKRCTIVMPANSAQIKVNAVRGYGAEVVLVETAVKSRASQVNELAAADPAAYIASAYDDDWVIQGNASLGDELAAAGEDWDAIVAPVGGGGLISGIATGLRRHGRPTVLLGAEPALANDAARSLRAGELLANDAEPQTIADGARTLSLGRRNWAIIRREVDAIVEVSEANIARALRLYFTHAQLKVEPTGALSLGAVLQDPERFRGRSVCCVVSGANVDPANYARLLLE